MFCFAPSPASQAEGPFDLSMEFTWANSRVLKRRFLTTECDTDGGLVGAPLLVTIITEGIFLVIFVLRRRFLVKNRCSVYILNLTIFIVKRLSCHLLTV